MKIKNNRIYNLLNNNLQKENLYLLCSVEKLKDKLPLKVEIRGFNDIAVVSVEGRITAFSNICPHKQISSLADGALIDDLIYCPHHNQGFNVFTGERISGGAPIKIYEPIIIDGKIYIELIEEKAKWTLNM